MIPECLNRGGLDSRLLLAGPGAAEQPLPLHRDSADALAAWMARPGEILTVLDPEGQWWRARLEKDPDAQFRAVPFAKLKAPPESALEIDLFQALPDRERLELVMEKAVEIGVRRIVPFESLRSLSLAERDSRQKKSHRWPEVIRRAAKQCRRGMLPELFPVMSWDETLEFTAQADVGLLLYEGEADRDLARALDGRKPSRIALVIGPEGGFARQEVVQARSSGLTPVSLGPRILRTESAAILAAALVQFIAGDLNRT